MLLENPGKGGTLNHLGVEVPDTAKVHAEIARLTGEGLFADEEIGTTCCFATQDKVWVTGPGGERWEVYTVLADSPTFGTSPQTPIETTAEADSAVTCCGGTAARRRGADLLLARQGPTLLSGAAGPTRPADGPAPVGRPRRRVRPARPGPRSTGSTGAGSASLPGRTGTALL